MLVEALIAAAALIAAPFVLPYFDAAPNTVNRILVWGLFGIGFDILFGYTGLLSFGQSALYGTGGFVAAYLLTRDRVPARRARRSSSAWSPPRSSATWSAWSRCGAPASTSP